MPISDYYGEIKRCTCTNPEVPIDCKFCLCRGYLARCMACDGVGQITQAMAGGPGSMKSTCGTCGGKGTIPVRKPVEENVEIQAEVAM